MAVGNEMPMMVNLGVMLDIFASVLILGIFLNKIGDVFKDVDVDRYTINGKETQVFVSAREIDSSNIPSDTWINNHLKYKELLDTEVIIDGWVRRIMDGDWDMQLK
jgi:hypothetical protein